MLLGTSVVQVENLSHQEMLRFLQAVSHSPQCSCSNVLHIPSTSTLLQRGKVRDLCPKVVLASSMLAVEFAILLGSGGACL